MKKGTFLILGLFVAWNLYSRPADRVSEWKDFLTKEGTEWSSHFTDRGTVRSLYGKGRILSASADEAKSRVLDSYASLLGIDSPSQLRLHEKEVSQIGTHYYYQQYYSGFPVVGGDVAIHLNHSNQLIGVSSSFKSGLAADSIPLQSSQSASATALRFFQGKAIAAPGKLMLLPSRNRGKLVWEIAVDSTELSAGSWVFYVDAGNPNMVLRARKTHAAFEGRGSIWLENPVVTPKRTRQTFLNMDGTKALSGKFVKAFNANFEHDVSTGAIDTGEFTTASEANRAYDYIPTDARLTEAMAYFHINRVHDQWRSFGFNKLNARAPVFVNVTVHDGGVGLDNAFYSRNGRFRTGIYVFGAGNRLENLGLDSDVYYHEYGHGVLDKIKPGFFLAIESNYPGAVHEAFGDISASAITEDPKLAEFGLRLKSSKRFVGRTVANQNRFPQNVGLPPSRKSEVHHTGLILGGAWWDLRNLIGSHEAQRILFASLPLLPNETDFFDVKDAMLTADQNLNGGANRLAIEDAFRRHGLGIVDPGQPGQLTMTALKTAAENDRGQLILKTTFKKGDPIFVVANYRANGLTPGFNMIPVEGSLKGPRTSTITGFLFVDEVVNGTRTGRNGAVQGILFTDLGTVSGTYTISIHSRLGGTGRTSPGKSAKFKVN